MTESEWLKCDKPEKMVKAVADRSTGRKLRLFACACCRRLWDDLKDQRTRDAVVVAEQFADGEVGKKELARARLAARAAAWNAEAARAQQVSWDAAGRVAWFTTKEAISSGAAEAARTVAWLGAVEPMSGGAWLVGDTVAARGRITGLVRDVFGNPFRPARFRKAWTSPTVSGLAQAAYEERHLPSGELDPHRLAVLADALEEVGASGELVAHLRGPGPHVRGCHVIDLCLGKS